MKRLLTLLTIFSAAGGCQTALNGDNMGQCPCAIGWQCCPGNQLCVPDNAVCPTFDASGSVADMAMESSTATVCNGGWCWVNPLPQGVTLRGIGGTAPDDVWAVGDGETIVHFDGKAWSPSYFGKGTLLDVWAASRTDAWAVGTELLHWDGHIWQPYDLGATYTIRSIWGTSSGQAAFAGDGVTGVWGGDVWQVGRIDPAVDPRVLDPHVLVVWQPTANDFWYGADTDVYRENENGGYPLQSTNVRAAIGAAIGAPGDGGLDPDIKLYLLGLGGTSSDDVWALYSSNLISQPELFAHWDGQAWNVERYTFTLPQGRNPSLQHRVLDVNYVLAGGRRLFCRGADDVWLTVPEWDSVLHYSASTGWVVADSITTGSRVPNALWGTSNLLLGSGNQGALQRWVGTDFVDDLSGSNNYYQAVFPFSPTDVWLSGLSGFDRWDGQTLTRPPQPFDGGVSGVWMRTPDDGWAQSMNAVSHWNGQAWSAPAALDQSGIQAKGPPGGAIWSRAAADVWLSDSGGLFHYDGAIWKLLRDDNACVTAIWGSGPNDVHFAGHGCTGSASGGDSYFHWDGSSFTDSTSPVIEPAALHGTASNDVWMVGDEVAHFDGTVWSRVLLEANQRVNAVWAAAPDDVWFATDGPTNQSVYHWSGSDITLVPSVGDYLVAIGGSSPKDLWAAGFNGAVVHRVIP